MTELQLDTNSMLILTCYISGHYMILTSEFVPDDGGEAELISMYYPPNVDHDLYTCLNFWYNARLTTGVLSVSINSKRA